MKRSLISLIISAFLLGVGWFVPHSIFDVILETPTPLPATALPTESPAVALPASLEPAAPARDPYGELYFTITKSKSYYPPATPPPFIEETLNLVRLPGSCVVGLIECPAVEEVPTPFDMKDVLAFDSNSGALIWSPDGRYGLLVIHPEDDLTRGKTEGEWEQLLHSDLRNLQISDSTLYLFDAQENAWREVYRAERKFFYSVHWSPDGQWIAFTVANSPMNVHPLQVDDGVYVVHPDGSGLQYLGGKGGYVLGWIGKSLLLQRPADPIPGAVSSAFEMLTFERQIKSLFESSRVGPYAYLLAPDGGALLVMDTLKPTDVDLLALDGSVIHSFGTFLNNNPANSMPSPLAWSSDGSLVAFANLRRVYVAPRVSQNDTPSGQVGVPPDTREVYVASDQSSMPWFLDFEFSSDNKYLLMNVFEGFAHLVTVALDTGQVILFDIPDMDPFHDANYLGDPGFFSWRP
jgi:WD40 repeat protein